MNPLETGIVVETKARKSVAIDPEKEKVVRTRSAIDLENEKRAEKAVGTRNASVHLQETVVGNANDQIDHRRLRSLRTRARTMVRVTTGLALTLAPRLLRHAQIRERDHTTSPRGVPRMRRVQDERKDERARKRVSTALPSARGLKMQMQTKKSLGNLVFSMFLSCNVAFL